MEDRKIKIAIAGVGNCASALLQGIEYYRHTDKKKIQTAGLINYSVAGYKPYNIEVVAAFDIDERKVGKPLDKALFAKPNCTDVFFKDIPSNGVTVQMGELLDGVAEHMKEQPKDRTFVVSKKKPCDVKKILRSSGAEILLNYLPVGSEKASEFYARCCLDTNTSFINCMPVFIVSNPKWAERFKKKNIPVVGDDIKAQIGATIVHRALTKLFEDRGVKIERTYQLNTGGNTDFLNMMNSGRLRLKKISKTQAVQSQMKKPLEPENIHIGPSDYVAWQNDNKVCFLRIEGKGFGDFPVEIELRLSVEDSPNSAGVSIDAIRCCKLARDRKIGGPLHSISAWTMKHPPKQLPDNLAKESVEKFIKGEIKS
ncbi:MAG: inositol-3-phosphate synthase [Candidatus Omnitrophota bacterium]